MLSLAVLISGGGRTLKNLLGRKDAGELPVRFAVVVSSRPDAGGLQHARDAGVPVHVVQRSDYESVAAFSDEIFRVCREAGADLVVMGGFLKHVLVPEDFHERVINIHPSLIPDFAGKGYYGDRVHRAVLEAGVPETGCTVHFVDDEYDHGPILLQRRVAVEPTDDVQTLANRVFQAECEALPEAIRQLAARRRA